MSLGDAAALAALGWPVVEAVTRADCDITVRPGEQSGRGATVCPLGCRQGMDGCEQLVEADNDDMGLVTSPLAGLDSPTRPPGRRSSLRRGGW